MFIITVIFTCGFGCLHFYSLDRVTKVSYNLWYVPNHKINFIPDLDSSCILHSIIRHISLLFSHFTLYQIIYWLHKIFSELFSGLPSSPPISIVLQTLLLDHLFFGWKPAAKQCCPPTKNSRKHFL